MTSSTPSSTNSYEQHPDVVWGPSPKLPGNLPDDLAEARLPATGKKIPRSDLETCECSKCGEFKAPAEFYKKNRLETKGTCKRCWAAYMAERRKAQPKPQPQDTKAEIVAEIEALESKLAELEDACAQLKASNAELHERAHILNEKFSAYVAGMVAQANLIQLGKSQAPEVKVAVADEPATAESFFQPKPVKQPDPLPEVLDTKPLREAIAKSLAEPNTAIAMRNYYLLNGAPFVYGVGQTMSNEPNKLKPYVTSFDPEWKQMRKEDKLAQIEADKDNPLADLM